MTFKSSGTKKRHCQHVVHSWHSIVNYPHENNNYIATRLKKKGEIHTYTSNKLIYAEQCMSEERCRKETLPTLTVKQ